MSYLFKQVVVCVLLIAMGCGSIARVYAAAYGTSTYGGGNYNVGQTPAQSTTPSSIPTGSTSTASPPGCAAPAPRSSPWLYAAVAQDSTTMRLYFTDAADPVDHYVLEYGSKSGDYPWGATNIGGKGMRTYDVRGLQPNTTYYFRIRGGNGCATGNWSNELSSTTKGVVTLKQLSTTNLDMETSPTIPETSPAPQQQQGASPKASGQGENAGAMEGYTVNIKVTDPKQKPIVGASVTIHSSVQTAKTDEQGIARFSNVEPGDHRVLVAYNGYEGEQHINLTGDVKEFSLHITVEPKNVLASPQVIALVAGLGIVIVVLGVLLLRARRKNG